MFSIFSTHGLISEKFFEYAEWTDVSCPTHSHYTFELVIVLSGNFTAEIEDKVYTLGKNDILMITPLEKHRFETNGDSHIAIIEAAPEIIPDIEKILKNKTFENPVQMLSERDMEFIKEHMYNIENSPLIELNCIFFTLLSIMMKKNALVSFNVPDDIFRRALLYTNEHFEENICLKDIAKALNVSYVYLSRMFSEKSGMKFSEFLNNFRIRKAVYMLLNSDASISEICYGCGWGSLRNFNRVFSKEMLCTPKEFRKKMSTSKEKDFYK